MYSFVSQVSTWPTEGFPGAEGALIEREEVLVPPVRREVQETEMNQWRMSSLKANAAILATVDGKSANVS